MAKIRDIKLIAVDMDGTFLNVDKTYNLERFQRLYQQMKEKGIHFVVASGNQFYQLQSYFEDIQEEIGFVAENGAYVADAGEEVYYADMNPQLVEKALASFHAFKNDIPIVICGKNSAYIRSDVADAYFELFNIYYKRLKKVDSLEEIDDAILKFATAYDEDEDIPKVLEHLHGDMEGQLTPVSSGHGFVDLIQPGVHKANGLKMLQERWGISNEQTAAFGDSPNDLEMLKHVEYSFAMGNADPAVKAVAKTIIGDNSTEALLDTIEEILNETQ